MDFFKSAVASAIARGTAFPYNVEGRLDHDDSIWTLNNATRREDGSACSLFTLDQQKNKSRLPLARNALRKLRTLRHPGVIKVIDTIETETSITIITERLTPLSWQVKRKSISEETAKWGIHAVASTLAFINGDAASVHGNVRSSSIYTSESGEWKMGGFEILSSMKEDSAIIYSHASLMQDAGRFAPPEVSRDGWEVIKKNPLSATDSFGLAILIFEVFNGAFRGIDQMSQTKGLPPSMVQSYRRLTNSSPKVRLSVSNFLEQGKKSGGFFETPLIRLTDDLDNLGLKSEAERESLLSELEAASDDFPEEFFKMKVLPELLKSVEFGGGGTRVYAAVVKFGLKLSDEEFEAKLTPVIIRLFSSPDRAMRVCLLDSLPSIVHRLSQKDVSNKIYPSMATGFTDAAPIIREQTVKAVLIIIGKLTDRIINGELLRYLAKTANDEQPGIRTNTTICLGKIARNLGSSSRSKILVAAFTRSLRDPFLHARNAALMALCATIDVFTEDDCAAKILPNVCPSLLDKEKIVRDQANKTLDLYLARVRKHGATMADSALPKETAGGANPAATRIGNSTDSSWAGWAISSFTNKATTARGEIQPNENSLPALKQTKVPLATPSASGRTTPAGLLSPSAFLNRQSEETNSANNASKTLDEEPANAFEPWGELENDEDAFFDADRNVKPEPSPQLPKMTETEGEPDFAGWLAAQSQAKSKKSLPKGLSKASDARPVLPKSKSTVRATGDKAAKTVPIKKPLPKSEALPAKKPDLSEKATEKVDDGWDEEWD